MSLQCCYFILVSRFQSFIVESQDPLAKRVPLGLNATELTESLCPRNVAISVFVSSFQSFIVLSPGPLAKGVPLGLNATEAT